MAIENNNLARRAQVDYALSLLASKQWPHQLDEDDLMAMSRNVVSKLIEILKTQPDVGGK